MVVGSALSHPAGDLGHPGPRATDFPCAWRRMWSCSDDIDGIKAAWVFRASRPSQLNPSHDAAESLDSGQYSNKGSYRDR